jgi:GNAT superfamily N-acetyltransferase/ribosomal protein S18 acetylase RimI-like enzyme
MAATETLSRCELAPADARAAVVLSSEARWNQSEADWELMLGHGHGLGFRDGSGRLVASALSLPMGSGVGWISMVLVTASWRRRGLATRLVEDCAAWLEGRNIAPVLDATPDGEMVYGRMGFTTLLTLTRWHRSAGGGPSRPPRVRPMTAADLPEIGAYDHAVFGAERGFVLEDLLRRDGALAFTTTDGPGFLLARRGRLATQIGPLSAEDASSAIALLDAALGKIDGPVVVDALDAQPGFGAHLQRLGFVRQRPFARMIRGKATPFGDATRGFAVAGPELG